MKPADDGPGLSSRSPPADVARARRDRHALAGAKVLLMLVALRLVNAVSVRTFFQPDEFFQSLEPAWQLVFGGGSGAWLTWEWKHQLRSSLHPLLFAAVYYLADALAALLRCAPAARAELLVVAPKTAQAVVAALGDYYTWQLARRVYGEGPEAWAALAVTVVSPWQWFCATRTFSNCLETTLTIAALTFWPESLEPGSLQTGRLRSCFVLAAVACVLRPTNALVWLALAGFALYRSRWSARRALLREALVCGGPVLAVSAVADRLFYARWTFPPLRFLYFNLAQSLAVFYGRNDWHYYLSQGLPLLLTTALPFTLVGLYQALPTSSSSSSSSSSSHQRQSPLRTDLASTCLFMPAVLSLISHKEVRFIYPLLPVFHVFSAPPLVSFFAPALTRSTSVYMARRLLLLLFLLLINLVIALYTTLFHASGVIGVLDYLRNQHSLHSSTPTFALGKTTTTPPGITAGFLMPCHSTPWRSHMVYPHLHAWALSCEPPIDMTQAEKAAYQDEADRFYASPAHFLNTEMNLPLRHIPRRPSYIQPALKSPDANPNAHIWPDYLVFFAQLEPTMQSVLRRSAYGECYRTFNSHWHDDSRRTGDVVVWCLDSTEQGRWAIEKGRIKKKKKKTSRSWWSQSKKSWSY
ncbi:hypothetical protein ASPZODRAFT_15506 [Penicilliopsis zonata CBS 506.65]|uniref:Mannosyltransferase n=1 Tax=Penicilliopsis zonata CBS 506.65 TaxID=1073090 RepID=A0A1L9SHX0_9EURO|nr:hypothetical protein ASPZODRAFT_15506 [Penicilliopsis zonata CBS 506.65]OJJ46812.1 hypothetical protein ASPZODRAFT_15506 [Penicilliopsis zonata CBS 506.65]